MVADEKPDLDGEIRRLNRENAKLREAVEEMDRIHSDIMENGPRCTCGDGDEWCRRCGKSIKLSAIASIALKS